MGTMWDVFHSLGTLPDKNDVLKIQASLSQMEEEQAFSIMAEMPSGPEAVQLFSPLMALNTSGLAHAGTGENSPSAGRVEERDLTEEGPERSLDWGEASRRKKNRRQNSHLAWWLCLRRTWHSWYHQIAVRGFWKRSWRGYGILSRTPWSHLGVLTMTGRSPFLLS